jgi:hypothetical protein
VAVLVDGSMLVVDGYGRKAEALGLADVVQSTPMMRNPTPQVAVAV